MGWLLVPSAAQLVMLVVVSSRPSAVQLASLAMLVVVSSAAQLASLAMLVVVSSAAQLASLVVVSLAVAWGVVLWLESSVVLRNPCCHLVLSAAVRAARHLMTHHCHFVACCS